MKYAELDGIVYRAQDDKFYGERLMNGEWSGKNVSPSKVARDAMSIDEDEAREIAGDQWPKESAPAA